MVRTIRKPNKMAAILFFLPFENRTLKRSVFEWIRYSSVRNSSPHCTWPFNNRHFLFVRCCLFELWLRPNEIVCTTIASVYPMLYSQYSKAIQLKDHWIIKRCILFEYQINVVFGSLVYLFLPPLVKVFEDVSGNWSLNFAVDVVPRFTGALLRGNTLGIRVPEIAQVLVQQRRIQLVIWKVNNDISTFWGGTIKTQ